jgi:hypothetical protein
LLEIDQFCCRFCIISNDNKLYSSISEVHTTKKLQSSDKNHAAGDINSTNLLVLLSLPRPVYITAGHVKQRKHATF